MAEERSKKSKRPAPKSRMMKNYEVENEAEEYLDDDPFTEQPQQQRKVLKMPPIQQETAQKKTRSLKPSAADYSKHSPGSAAKELKSAAELKAYVQQIQPNNATFENPSEMLREMPGFSALPPITTTENLTDILQTQLEPLTIKAFKVKRCHH